MSTSSTYAQCVHTYVCSPSSDVNVQVSCLTCYGAIISISPSHREVEKWLAGPEENADTVPWLLKHCISIFQLQSTINAELLVCAMCHLCHLFPICLYRFTCSPNRGLADNVCFVQVLLPSNQWLLGSSEGILSVAFVVLATSCSAACLEGELSEPGPRSQPSHVCVC